MTATPRLEMTEVVKTFGPVRALDAVSLEVGAREVHGLLGGNGAGKTTLMNVLFGLYRADSGAVRIDGREVTITSPRDAIELGVGMVHQTFLQVDTYTVIENVVLGTTLEGGSHRGGLAAARAKIAEISDRFGLDVDPDAVVEELPVGVRQRVEIIKALYRGASVLILDEPTTNLTPQEVDALFASLRTMVAEGMSVILITHKIRETLAVCDRMTVMRDGARVQTLERTETDAEHLAAIMVGESHGTYQAPTVTEAVALGTAPAGTVVGETPAGKVFEPGVSIAGVTVRNDHDVDLVVGFDLEVGRGEVVGFAGVAGNGQVELAEALAGVRPLRSGTISVGDMVLSGRPTAQWLDAGVAYVPEDRHRDGILPTSGITENLILGSHRSARVRRGGLIDWRAARQRAEEAIAKFAIRADSPATRAGDLSGGNIQRVILARAFAHEPRLLILHNPTRGLDIGSTRFVYEQIRAATAGGCSVVVISEDLDEVIAISDRVIALYHGSQAGEWRSDQVDPYEVGRRMTGLGTPVGGTA
ncbi:ABC transporter ATP-binding protein [Nocardioides marmotae]|uniref:ATP-binding cassette domain-containing protein n=1 Tax=Nocardioides marmotae TaxID=2663857 RepID=A0A6I3IYX4_9ACTN|nr:ABC transporter ATP-binding protein [Nocardioides marmotae]MCR6030279.1 ATP-binding cassette domain-containing protein [Gordonia jinghuaiqii]MBC9734430.1 ABC transporter ATP-binding protein [Nocardioides marmotae]MTB85530.1 ATP-binding cassette domain-containing protein [Nocardioides marmotae]MTB93911.1 ATP-binding cassette domain-containing protein [Nocardioides marmotae]QKE00232.1 ABC transporter ATP-binding protein [Nocardioides marmotae]